MNLLRPKELDSIAIKVVKSKGRCKYHPKIGQSIKFRNILPKGVCPYAYAAIYPYALSLLYDAEFSWRKHIDKDSVIAQCLRPGNQMVFKIKRIKNPKINKRLLKKYQEERYKIIFEFIEKKGGPRNCSDCLGYKNMVVGKSFEFNRGDLPEMCPAAFNQLFPYLASLLTSGKKRFKARFACPDPKTDVCFEVSKR